MAESGFLRDYLTGNNGLQRSGFGDISVSETNAIIAWNFHYNINSDIISSTNANGGTVTQANSQAVLQTSTATNGSAEITTIDSLRYISGIGGKIRFTAVFSTPQANSKQVIGLGDENDGFFIGYNSTNFGFLRRQNGNETWVYTSDANPADIPDGFDPTNGNVYQIKFQWLGYGEIRYFIENPEIGGFVLAHRIQYANSTNIPSIFNPSLPLHAKVINSGNATNITLRTPSAMAGIEGNINNELLSVPNGANNENLSVTDEYPILTVKNSTLFQGVTNRQRVKLNEISIASDGTKPVKYILYKNATLSTAANFTDLSSEVSPVQRDILSTSISSGRVLTAYYLGRTESRTIDVASHNYKLAPGETFTITAQSTLATIASVAMNVQTLF